MNRERDAKPEDPRISVVRWLADVGRAAAKKLVTPPTPLARPHDQDPF